MLKKNEIRIALFGTSRFSCLVFDELIQAEYKPAVLVTTPDSPSGRGLRLAAPPAKEWAKTNGIDVLQPETLDSALAEVLDNTDWDIFIVASYGKILPVEIIGIPTHGSLNVHPSYLPMFRGASPIQTSILQDARETGITIISMDKQMDHGDIIAQSKVIPETWPLRADILEELLAKKGGILLSDIIPDWIRGEINPTRQKHSEATYSKKFTKSDGELNLEDEDYNNYLRYCAFYGTLGTYFYTHKGNKKIRVKIKDASYESGKFKPLRIIPEGKKEIDYEAYNSN